jgi:hypothetical protein
MLAKLNFFSLLGAVALFFLPWIELSCSDQKSAERLVIGTQTGLQIATGKASPSKQLDNLGREFGSDEGSKEQPEKEDLDASFLVAAGGVLTAGALLFALLGAVGSRGAAGFSALLATTALICLVAQWQQGFPVESNFAKQVRQKGRVISYHHPTLLKHTSPSIPLHPCPTHRGGGWGCLRSQPTDARMAFGRFFSPTFSQFQMPRHTGPSALPRFTTFPRFAAQLRPTSLRDGRFSQIP